MITSYDEKFDRKVELGAQAILKERKVAQEHWEAEMPAARQEARMVLLTAQAIDAGQLN